MPLPGWRHLCMCLALVVLGSVVWLRYVTPTSVALAEETRAAIGQPGALQHDLSDPALPQVPTSDGEPAEGELDSDSPERMALLSEMLPIPPAACAGRLAIDGQDLRRRIESRAFDKPPRV